MMTIKEPSRILQSAGVTLACLKILILLEKLSFFFINFAEVLITAPAFGIRGVRFLVSENNSDIINIAEGSIKDFSIRI